MDIEPADTDMAGVIADAWVELADTQRQYGTHLLGAENRSIIRESVIRHAVAGTLLVAREDGHLRGFVMFSVESGSLEQDVRRGIIENLFVAAGYRGAGIGSRLLEAAEANLADRGVEAVALDVMADNEPAREFYRGHGYGQHRIELEKTLESDTHSKDGG